MNFFEHQDRARRNTSVLVGYFVIALVAIVIVVTLAVYVALFWLHDGRYPIRDWIHSPAFLWCGLGTLAVILAGSLHKMWQLRDGGEALAQMLGAREIPPSTNAPNERQLRNVVEEMALASGIPAPRTFVLDQEQGINAMVAGYRPTEAVVMVTRGTLEQLGRDELQGVIAHEYSHIFNADMRMNMRLMAVLAGILAIGKVGEFLMHSSRRRRYSSRNNNQSGLVLLGLALVVIGYVGLFFGRLIKAAISRQRELLADASAVQFTRNPAGLAGALISIRNGPGSYLGTPHAEDMNHMCFGDTISVHFRNLLATHPPMDERLAAIGPEWVARARVRARNNQPGQTSADTPVTPPPEATMGFAGEAGTAPAPTPPSSPAERVGVVGADQLDYANSLHHAIPETLMARLHQPQGAQQVVMALMTIASRGAPSTPPAALDLSADDALTVSMLAEQIAGLGARLRLPLLDLAMPALKALPDDDKARLCARTNAVVASERPVRLAHFLIAQLVNEHLRKRSGRALKVRFKRYEQVAGDLQVLLSLMVHASGAREDDAQTLFRQAGGALLDAGRTLLPLERCSLTALQAALTNLRDLTPLLKAPLVDTLADIIVADGEIKVAEIELLRAVCSLIDCPVPPLQGMAA